MYVYTYSFKYAKYAQQIFFMIENMLKNVKKLEKKINFKYCYFFNF